MTTTSKGSNEGHAISPQGEGSNFRSGTEECDKESMARSSALQKEEGVDRMKTSFEASGTDHELNEVRVSIDEDPAVTHKHVSKERLDKSERTEFSISQTQNQTAIQSANSNCNANINTNANTNTNTNPGANANPPPPTGDGKSKCCWLLFQ